MKRSKTDFPDSAALWALVDDDGRLALRVTPGARSESLTIEDGELVLKVRARPQDGAANAAVVHLVADAFGLAPSRIELLRGATSRQKLLRFAR